LVNLSAKESDRTVHKVCKYVLCVNSNNAVDSPNFYNRGIANYSTSADVRDFIIDGERPVRRHEAQEV